MFLNLSHTDPIWESNLPPAFHIARSEFFFVLAPPVENPDRTELLGISTWASRGWCRLEKALKELQPEKKYIVPGACRLLVLMVSFNLI